MSRIAAVNQNGRVREASQLINFALSEKQRPSKKKQDWIIVSSEGKGSSSSTWQLKGCWDLHSITVGYQAPLYNRRGKACVRYWSGASQKNESELKKKKHSGQRQNSLLHTSEKGKQVEIFQTSRIARKVFLVYS